MLRDHLFISYAWEDGALAEWLALKLTVEGYMVWCDRLKLLGGERWPEDIDRAIKARTYRMLHLISSHSIRKENPSKERQLALTLGKQRGEEFLIPLNVDGTQPANLPWQLTDITYIPFENWADGLCQLLKKLEVCQVPRHSVEEGRKVGVSAFLNIEAVLDEPEILESNVLRFLEVPEVVQRFEMAGRVDPATLGVLPKRWAHYPVSNTLLLAFTSPPAELGLEIRTGTPLGVCWREAESVDGVPARDVVSSLLRKSLAVKCFERGLMFNERGAYFYFPSGLLARDRMRYMGYKGRQTGLLVVGRRKIGQIVIVHHLGVSFSIRRNIVDPFAAVVKIHLHLVDAAGLEVEPTRVNARRKAIVKSWWNHQWLSRQMALRAHLAAGSGRITIGEIPGEQVVLEAKPIEAEVETRVNEAALAPLRARLQAQQATEAGIDDLDELREEEP
ncbi:MAG: toll/interleukin-1 receptor domain-containing protein [Actinomycetota bacterium]|nr:toll/interleukin-1 receptor domain-containing protein [Actinomycetota bacterium]